ncbi:hypothetical protein KNU49_gp074 [Streptomyces phage EGole]|uniref:Uncharacterized protein n=1 Tax=Streptomyces phage EGole TaxID=2517973 RepID=A0A482JAS5_9CAUD|nr:hypothetical protein KNU49_gp074 [Streptomyces phage EGole]QBP30980.1 hypothetical protein SEA_EGOLE_240 [Streptomyces phage EGole]
MLTVLGAVYLVGVGACVGIAIGMGIFVSFITLGSDKGMELAGSIVARGFLTAIVWPVLMPYRVIRGKLGK